MSSELPVARPDMTAFLEEMARQSYAADDPRVTLFDTEEATADDSTE